MSSLPKYAPLVLAAFLFGCAEKPHDHDHDDHDDHAGEAGEAVAGIAALGPADQKLALAQKTCPVSGEALGGAMGTPIKVSAGDRTAFLCCEGCRKAFERNPDMYLKKLDR